MQTKTNYQTLIPALVFLIVFIFSVFGKKANAMTINEILIAIGSFVGTIHGVLTNHKILFSPTTQPVPILVSANIAPPDEATQPLESQTQNASNNVPRAP